MKIEIKQFAEWLASPVKDPKTQIEYAAKFGMCQMTLTKWKRRPEFKSYYKELVENLYRKHEAEIVDNFGEEAKKEWKTADAFLKHIRNRDLDEGGGGDITIVIKNPFKDE